MPRLMVLITDRLSIRLEESLKNLRAGSELLRNITSYKFSLDTP